MSFFIWTYTYTSELLPDNNCFAKKKRDIYPKTFCQTLFIDVPLIRKVLHTNSLIQVNHSLFIILIFTRLTNSQTEKHGTIT